MLNTELFLTNIIGICTLAITFCLGAFVIFKGPKTKANIAFFVLTLSLDTFYISHLLGINAHTAYMSRNIFMFNLANIPITISVVNFIYFIFGKKTLFRRIVVYLADSIGLVLFIFFIFHPDLFMKLSVPKLYLPFYYVRGSLYWIQTLYFSLFGGYVIYDLFRIYIVSNSIEKNRVKYIFFGFLYAYPLGASALLLLYDIPFDPLYSMFFGLYTIPFAYAFLKYDLLDIHIIAKRAFYYAVSIVSVSIIIIIINVINNLLLSLIPGFPIWLVPLMSGGFAVAIGVFIWNKLREVERLRYEFISIITHKFRTPLTSIKWSTESLDSKSSSEDRDHSIMIIKDANSQLIELTELLIGLEQMEASNYAYTFTTEDICSHIRRVIEGEKNRLVEKKIVLNEMLPSTPVLIPLDKKRIELVFQILLENAISYTPENGSIDIKLEEKKNKVILSFKDSGIGISKQQLPYVFKKFFRSSEAKLANTEGMGIGLFLALNIMKNQNGDIRVDSEGVGKGTLFSVIMSR